MEPCGHVIDYRYLYTDFYKKSIFLNNRIDVNSFKNILNRETDTIQDKETEIEIIVKIGIIVKKRNNS